MTQNFSTAIALSLALTTTTAFAQNAGLLPQVDREQNAIAMAECTSKAVISAVQDAYKSQKDSPNWDSKLPVVEGTAHANSFIPCFTEHATGLEGLDLPDVPQSVDTLDDLTNLNSSFMRAFAPWEAIVEMHADQEVYKGTYDRLTVAIPLPD